MAQVYKGMPFSGFTTIGTPVAVTAGTTHTGVNFAMGAGGSLSGTVTDAGTGVPLQGVQIAAYGSTGQWLKTVPTDAVGAFTMSGLPAGTYYVSTSVPVLPPPFYIDELFDNLPCLGCVTITGAAFPIVTLPCTQSCTPVTSGTQVVVTNGTTRTGVDFALATGAGVITGVVTDAVTGIGLVNVQVSVYNPAGVVVKSVTSAPNTGAFTVRGLAPGTYYARTTVSPATPYYTDVAHGNGACAPCTVTSTSPITVTANAATVANFALSSGGSITGLVTVAGSTNPLASVDVQVFKRGGNSREDDVLHQHGRLQARWPAGGDVLRAHGGVGHHSALCGRAVRQHPLRVRHSHHRHGHRRRECGHARWNRLRTVEESPARSE